MNRKKFNFFIMVALCVSLLAASVVAAYAGAYEDTAAAAAKWGKKYQEALKLTKDAEERAAIMQDAIAAKKTQLDETQKKVDAKQKEIDEQTEALNERLNVMYKTGTVGFIDVVLSSDSVADLLMNLGLVQKILKNDQDILMKMQEDLKELQELQAKLKKEKDELDAQKKELDEYIVAKKAEADKDRAMQEELEARARDLYASTMRPGPGVPVNPPSSGNYVWPTQGVITSNYGYRICPFHGREFHNGIDIARSPAGTPVYAIAAGVVGKAGWDGGYGNCVTINHGGGLMSLYGHLQKVTVSKGQSVSKGQLIGYMGSTGNSTGPHLHFTVMRNEVAFNPLSLY